jgi:hypothetical protein
LNPLPPRLVLPNHTKRDALWATAIGVIILAFLAYGIWQIAQPVLVQGNERTGVIVGKKFTPVRERQIRFSGKKIQGTTETDGEYLLEVRVVVENRVYEVPVEKAVYEGKAIGNSITFLRPESEQASPR